MRVVCEKMFFLQFCPFFSGYLEKSESLQFPQLSAEESFRYSNGEEKIATIQETLPGSRQKLTKKCFLGQFFITVAICIFI